MTKALNESPRKPQIETVPINKAEAPLAVRRFQLSVEKDGRATVVYESLTDRCSIGSHPANDCVIDDSTVSRFHCEIELGDGSPEVRDLGSRNGTIVDGVRIFHSILKVGSTLQLGSSTLRFDFQNDVNALPFSRVESFGSIVGRSPAMRVVIALLERAASSDATVILEGETGTGKGAAAEAIHLNSGRRAGPFVVVDCSAISTNLVESELFGHEKGAFTGAMDRRLGAFESASRGTLFLDEVGELAPDIQPKLLRVLENREVRRVGSSSTVPVDVRVIAATNRDLRSEVNSARFRADLYFRLAVLKVVLPPLRDRMEDIPDIASRLIETLDLPESKSTPLLSDAFMTTLKRFSWPGNVRELRNYLERCAIFGADLSIGQQNEREPDVPIDVSDSFYSGRERVLSSYEKRYVNVLLHAHQGRVGRAAEAAGIGRVQLWRLMRKYGIEAKDT